MSSLLETGLLMLSNSVVDPTEKSMVQRWLNECRTLDNRRSRFDRILNAIENGYNTMAELVAETKIPRTTAGRLLVQLSEKKKISIHKVKNHNHAIEFRYEFVENKS